MQCVAHSCLSYPHSSPVGATIATADDDDEWYDGPTARPDQQPMTDDTTRRVIRRNSEGRGEDDKRPIRLDDDGVSLDGTWDDMHLVLIMH